jgi:hypothetical protein
MYVIFLLTSPTPYLGVLGDATVIAEHIEARAAPNSVSCSAATRAAYLASSYAFTPGEPAVPPGASIESSGIGGIDPRRLVAFTVQANVGD